VHIRRSRLVLVASVAAATTISFAGQAMAHEGDRKGGGGDGTFRIQAAVDAARPGDTIRIPSGTYAETVTITKDGITLRGHDVVISPPADAEPTACDTLFPSTPEAPAPTASGICVLGDVTVNVETFEVTVNDPVSNVTVRGITVAGAPFDGLIGIGTKDLTVRDSKFRDNGGYGAASFNGEGTTFRNNVATGNGEAGFYVGDSPEAHADVRGNHSYGNVEGYFFRNASHGTVRGNVAEGNCVGVLVLAGAPGPATDWHIRDNQIRDNNAACPPAGEEPQEDGPPPLSGAGIALVGAQMFEVEDNRVSGHAAAGPSLLEGGIVVISTNSVNPPPPAEPVLAPDFDPSGEIEDNRLRDNQPADIVWDETGNVEFDDNRCATSATYAGAPLDLCDGRS
jgi:hypothetical protein